MGAIAVSNEAEWLSLRDSHVGGSEVASLFYRWRYADGTEAVLHLYETPPEGATLVESLSPFKTGYRLWQEKAGRVMPDDLSSNERVQAGNFLEPALAAWAGEKFKWKLRKVRRYCTHATVTGWGASLDYEAHEPGFPPIEFKNVDGLAFRDSWAVEGDEIIMPPLNYVLQLQHQIGAVGADHGWIVACVGGNRLLRGRIERHEPTQQKIAEAIAAFWEGVETGTEPKWVADYDSVAETYRYGSKALQVDLTADGDLPQLCADYLARKAEADQLEATISHLKGQIASKLGDAAKAVASGYRMSWPVVERPEKVIPERIQKALTYRGALTITPTL